MDDQRFTLRLTPVLVERLAAYQARRGLASRSEAARAILAEALMREPPGEQGGG